MRRLSLALVYFGFIVVVVAVLSLMLTLLTRQPSEFFSDASLIGLPLVIPSWARWIVAVLNLGTGLLTVYANIRMIRHYRDYQAYLIGLMQARQAIQIVTDPGVYPDYRVVLAFRTLERQGFAQIGAYEDRIRAGGKPDLVWVAASADGVVIVYAFVAAWNPGASIEMQTTFASGAVVETRVQAAGRSINLPNYRAAIVSRLEKALPAHLSAVSDFTAAHGDPLVIDTKVKLRDSSPLRVDAMRILLEGNRKTMLWDAASVGAAALLFTPMPILGPTSGVILTLGWASILGGIVLLRLMHVRLLNR